MASLATKGLQGYIVTRSLRTNGYIDRTKGKTEQEIFYENMSERDKKFFKEFSKRAKSVGVKKENIKKAYFKMRMKDYDGMAELFDFSTEEDKENLGYDDIVLVSILNKCIVTEDLYNFLKELYLYYGVEKKEDKGVVTMLIIKGLLRCKGYMTLNFGASTEELREDFKIIKIFEVDEIESKKEIIKKLENGEILKSTESKEVLFQNNENHKNETPKSEEILLKKNKKPIEQTYDSIRNWLLPLLRKDDKIIFPKEEFLERVKLFDEAEKLRTFNVIKSAVEHDNYCVKFEEGKTIRGYEVIKAFGEMLGIDVEEEVVEKIEKTEVEEEKKLTPQQLRKKKFLERMKKSEEKNNRKKKEVI